MEEEAEQVQMKPAGLSQLRTKLTDGSSLSGLLSAAGANVLHVAHGRFRRPIAA
jgi:hypothetical protein